MVLAEMARVGWSQKRYWGLLGKLEQRERVATEYVSPKNIMGHFKSILNSGRPLDMPPDSVGVGALDYPMTSEELEKTKHVLKRGRAGGLDTISNEMISCFLELFPHVILTLFNTILDKNVTIDDWTTGMITAIHKKGSRSDPENYRGISLLSCLGKFFTGVLYGRLLKFSVERGILSPAQLGFVPGNRTSDAHMIIHNLVHGRCHRDRGWLYSCFVDFSKAFDTIPRDKLLRKLLDFGVDGNFFNIIKNIYTNDRVCIKHGEKITDSFGVNLGVKQGCILSPLLFNIFLSDLPRVLESAAQSSGAGAGHPSSLFWADDIVMFSESEEGLRGMLGALEKYCGENELTLNTDKTKCMIFNKGGRLLRTPFYYGGDKLENVNRFKYLGFMITSAGGSEA